MQLLARHGVREYWLVDPEAVAIEVYSLKGNAFMLGGAATGPEHVQSALLPRLTLSPADLVPA
jgi:Uma2 family endonuclease